MRILMRRPCKPINRCWWISGLPGVAHAEWWVPIIEELAGAYAGKLKVGKLNTDHNPVVASKYGIRSIPTILLLKDGQVVGNLLGAMPKSEFQKMIDPHLQ